MTEAEWLACDDWQKMLEFLSSLSRLSERKARLFAAACARSVWLWMSDERSRQAVITCEQYADGLAGQKALKAARKQAFAASRFPTPPSSLPDYKTVAGHAAIVALDVCMNTKRHGSLLMTIATAGCANSLVFKVLGDAAGWTDIKLRCDLVRCVFGNPFHSIIITPSGLSWNDGTAVKLAQAIYNGRAFDRLPVLAGALEDAGCTNEYILNHCRGVEPHARGCWVVDLLLGKE